MISEQQCITSVISDIYLNSWTQMCPLPCSLLFLLSLAIFYFIVSSSSVAVVDRTMSLCRRSLLFPACRTAEVLRGLKTKGEWL